MRAGWSLDDVKLIPMTRPMRGRNEEEDEYEDYDVYGDDDDFINDGAPNGLLNEPSLKQGSMGVITEGRSPKESLKDQSLNNFTEGLSVKGLKKTGVRTSGRLMSWRDWQGGVWLDVKGGEVKSACGYDDVMVFSGPGGLVDWLMLIGGWVGVD